MAGPGGGPSRRSHTKSRKGCKTCKRRHIRCDETFPQCRNCTKHQVRCDYMDGPQAVGGDDASGSQQPGLMWTPEIENTIDLWQQTGNFPFPDLQLYPQPQWSSLSRVDLRLIYNVAQMCSESIRDATSKVIVWADLMPKFLSAAAPAPFVMHAVLSFSANHLAWASQSDETRDIAMHHRANALRGLHEAIGSFSQANSDAVLAASLLLAWQATDWRNWASLMTGITSITQAMQSWRDQSAFCDYLTEHASDPVRTYTDASEFRQTPERIQERALALQTLSAALDQLQVNLSDKEQGHRWVEQLGIYVRRLQSSTAALTPEEQFGQLYALRKWLFWVPVSLLSAQRREILPLLVLAHFYAAALAVEPIFPDLGADFVANSALNSLTEIGRIVARFQQSQGYSAGTQHIAALMQYPTEMASSYRSKRDWSRQSIAIPTVQQPPYGLDALNLDLTAQLSDQSYYHNMSPAFAPSPLHLASPAIMTPQSGGPRSPYLEVPGTPHSAVTATGAHNYLSQQAGNLYSPPLSAPLQAPAGFGTYAPAHQEQQAYVGSMGSTWHGGPTPHLQQQQQQSQQQQQQHHQQAYGQPPNPTGVLGSNAESDTKGKSTDGSGWMPAQSMG